MVRHWHTSILTEQHELKFSVETLRQWMPTAFGTPSNTERTSTKAVLAVHATVNSFKSMAHRSPHDWFEGRADKCMLIVFIDDATGKLIQCHFTPTETTEAYMTALAWYLDNHGRPLALYSDRHSIFSLTPRARSTN